MTTFICVGMKLAFSMTSVCSVGGERMNSEMEQTIMQLIVNGGDARSLSLRAIQAAEKDDFKTADSLLSDAKEAMVKAHDIQTGLIQEEVRGNHTELTLLMVHAQDHVMNAMTVKELAEHIINNRKEISQLKELVVKGNRLQA